MEGRGFVSGGYYCTNYEIRAEERVKLFCAHKPTWNDMELATFNDVAGNYSLLSKRFHAQERELQDVKEELAQIKEWLMMQSPATFTKDSQQCKQIVKEHREQFPINS